MTKNFAEFVVRNKYIDRNGGITEIVNDIEKKEKYEKFLQKLYKYEVNWKQIRAKKLSKAKNKEK